MGMKDTQSPRSIAFAQVPGYGPDFKVIQCRDSDAKYDLYIDRIKDLRPPGLFLPEDTEEKFMRELTQERLVIDPSTSKAAWPKPKGPNHGGDAIKYALTGWDAMTGGKLSQRSALPPEPAIEPAPV